MKTYWRITVNGWGTIYCVGTERQAEKYRADKQWYAGSMAMKAQVERETIPSDEEIYELRDLIRKDALPPRVFRAYLQKEE